MFLFFRCLVLLMVAVFFGSASAGGDDWYSGYVSRPGLVDILRKPAANRRLINLSGTWQAGKIDEDSSREIQVPGVYESEEVLVLSRTFSLDSSYSELNLTLVALGINDRCRIFLNGEYLQTHTGGHLPFQVYLPEDKLNFFGKNEIAVQVDNKRSARQTIPPRHAPGLPRLYGGIAREIFIVARPALSVSILKTSYNYSPDFESCSLSVKTQVDWQSGATVPAGLRLVIDLVDSSASQVVAKGVSISVLPEGNRTSALSTFTIPQYVSWRPDRPERYQARARLLQGRTVVDQAVADVGFGDLSISGSQFLINGEPTVLHGVDAYLGNQGLDPEQMTAAVKRIKALGADVVRFVGPPPHPHFLDICDRLGLLVFLEIPLSFVPDQYLTDSQFKEKATDYALGMVQAYGGHPCVGAWGIGVDVGSRHDETPAFIDELAGRLKEESDVPVYAVQRFLDPEQICPNVDFVLVDCFGESPGEISKKSASYLHLNKPVVFSVGGLLPQEGQVSAPISGAPHQGSETSVSSLARAAEEHQAYLLDQIFSAKPVEMSAGVFVNSLQDWPTSRPHVRFGRSPDNRLFRSGMRTQAGNKRLAFDVVQGFFAGTKDRRLDLEPAPEQNPALYPLIGIALILIFLFNFHRNRRLHGNLRRIFFYSHGFYSEVREQRKISAGQTFFVCGMSSLILGIILSGIGFHLRTSLVFDSFMNLLLGADALKGGLARLIWSPALSVPLFSILVMSGFGLLVVVLKLATAILGRRLRVGQLFTFTVWAGANFLWLLPVVPIFHRILAQTGWGVLAIILVAGFLGWFGLRLFNAVRITLGLSLPRTGVLVAVMLMLTVGSAALYYHEQVALFDYLPLYWHSFAGP